VVIREGGDEGLFSAAAAGDVALVRSLLPVDPADVVAVRVLDEARRTALHLALLQAVTHRRVEVVRLLLEAGARAVAVIHPNQTMLDAAGPGGYTTIARHAAVRPEDPEVLQLLLDDGADPNGQTPYSHPLHGAAEAGWVASVKLLLSAGADPNRRDHQGRTALHAAADADRVDTVRVLLDKGAFAALPDEEGQQAVDLAGPLVRSLLEGATAHAGARHAPELVRWPMTRLQLLRDGTGITVSSHRIFRWDLHTPDQPKLIANTQVRSKILDAVVVADQVVCRIQGPTLELEHLPPGFPRPHRLTLDIRPVTALNDSTVHDLAPWTANGSISTDATSSVIALSESGGLSFLRVPDLEVLGTVVAETVLAVGFHPHEARALVATGDDYAAGRALVLVAWPSLPTGEDPVVEWLADLHEDEHVYRIVFDTTGTRFYVLHAPGSSVTAYEIHAESDGSTVCRTLWTSVLSSSRKHERGDLIALADRTIVVASRAMYLTELDPFDGSVLREIELDRPMLARALAVSADGTLWAAGPQGLTAAVP